MISDIIGLTNLYINRILTHDISAMFGAPRCNRCNRWQISTRDPRDPTRRDIFTAKTRGQLLGKVGWGLVMATLW